MERNSNILQELPDWLLRYLLGQVDSEEEKKLRAVERMYGLSHFTKEEIIERLKTPEQFNTAEAFLTFKISKTVAGTLLECCGKYCIVDRAELFWVSTNTVSFRTKNLHFSW